MDMLVEDPLLLRCDSLWGDADLLTILNCDLALDDELPTLPSFGEPLLPPTGAAAACAPSQQPATSAAHSPSCAPCSPDTSSGSGSQCIYLPNAVCKGPPRHQSRSSSPALSGNTTGTGTSSLPSLPALSGAGAASGPAWRTVTTHQPTSTPGVTAAAPPAAATISIALDLLARMPSTTTTDSTPAASSGGCAPAPPPAKQARTTSACRTRKASSKAPARKQMLSDDDDTDSEDSIDTEGTGADAALQGCKSNKRKAPEIDWRSIEDPAERRRQRRLAKNRVTAARSRERKKSQWAEMEEKLNAMEADNRSLRQMLESMSKDNEALRTQLAAALSGAGEPAAAAAGVAAAKGRKHTEPAVLVLIATLLLLCAFLPSNSSDSQQQQVVGPAALLGGAALLSELLQLLLTTRSGCGRWSSRRAGYYSRRDMSKHEADNDAELDMMMLVDDAQGAPDLLAGSLIKSEPLEEGPMPAADAWEQPCSSSCSSMASSALHVLGALLMCLLAAVKQLRSIKCVPPSVARGAQRAAKALRAGSVPAVRMAAWPSASAVLAVM